MVRLYEIELETKTFMEGYGSSVALIEDKKRESRLRWFSKVDAVVRT